MTPKDVAEQEQIKLGTLYNILNGMLDCDPKVWRGWVFVKHSNNRWEAIKRDNRATTENHASV